MRKEVTTILEELYEVHPHLRSEEQLIPVVETFLKTKVSVSPRQEFKEELKNQLLSAFPRTSFFSFNGLKYIKVFGSLLASGVLAYSLFSFFFLHIQPISSPVSEINAPVSENISVEKDSSISPNQEYSLKNDASSQKKSGENSDIPHHQDTPTPKKSLEQPQKGETSITQNSSSLKSSSKERDYAGPVPESSDTFPSDALGAGVQDSFQAPLFGSSGEASVAPNSSLKSSAPFMADMMFSSDGIPSPADQTKYTFEIVGTLRNTSESSVYSLQKNIETPQGYTLYYDAIHESYSLSRGDDYNDSGSVTIHPSDIPTSEELMRQISSFLSTIGVSSDTYELSPGYISSLLSSVFDQNISIDIPYLLKGKEIYDEQGNKIFLHLDYNLLSKKFQYVGPIFSFAISQNSLSRSELFSDNLGVSGEGIIQLAQESSVYIKLSSQGKTQFVSGHIYRVVKKVDDIASGQRFLYPDIGGGKTPIQIQE